MKLHNTPHIEQIPQAPQTALDLLIYTQDVKVKILAKQLKLFYPDIYPNNKPQLYFNLSNKLLKVINIFNTNGTIHKKALRHIKTLQENEPLFVKDTARNYSNSPNCKKAQGYTATAQMDRIINLAIYHITLAPQPTTLPLALPSPSKPIEDFMFDAVPSFIIKKDDLLKLDSNLKMKLLPHILGVKASKFTDVYFFNNIKDYSTLNGRVYNTFQALPKAIKVITDTPYELDISSAGQSLMMSTVYRYMVQKNTEQLSYKEFQDLYPNASKYINKKAVCRSEAQMLTNKSTKWVKKLFTVPLYGGNQPQKEFNAIFNKRLKQDNLPDMAKDYSKFVNAYYKEVGRLRTTVFNIFKDLGKRVTEDEEIDATDLRAYNYITKRMNEVEAKRLLYNENNTQGTQKKPLKPNEYKKKIIYYFIEFYESLVRNFMIIVAKREYPFIKIQENHDGIYTDIDISPYSYQIIKMAKEYNIYVTF